MAIQEYVHGEYLKKLIDDKLVNANSVKYILKKKGIMPICAGADKLADLVYYLFLGSGVMTQIHDVMNFEQSNQKSTMVVIQPAEAITATENSFIENLTDEFVKLQRIPSTPYSLKNLRMDNGNIYMQYCFDKPQKGRISMASTRSVTLDVSITPISHNQYKVNIRHEGISESKQFISLLDDMVKVKPEDKVFSMKRINLQSLQKNNKVDLFDLFGSYTHKEWTLINITNVTVNKNERVINEDDADDLVDEEISENEPTGRLTGISSAILTGDGLRNNEFVKDCMLQGFIFSSMRYKFQHKTQPTTVEIELNFKQSDLKIIIIKTFKTEDDGKDYLTPLPSDEQSEIIDYFQNVAYSIYSALIEKQKRDKKMLSS